MGGKYRTSKPMRFISGKKDMQSVNVPCDLLPAMHERGKHLIPAAKQSFFSVYRYRKHCIMPVNMIYVRMLLKYGYEFSFFAYG